MNAWARSIQRRDDVGVAGVDDVEDLERLDAQLERVDRAAACTAPRGSPAGRTARPGRWLTASSNGAPTIATSAPRARSSIGSGDPGQLHERRQADVGGQVEVASRTRTRGPSRCARRSRASPGVVGTLGHGGPPACGRRRFGSAVQRGALGGMVPRRCAAGSATAVRGRRQPVRRSLGPARNSRHAPSTSVGSRSRSSAVWATSVAARSVVWSARGRAAASRNSVVWPGVGDVGDRELRVDRRHRPTRRWPCRSSPTSRPCPGPRSRTPRRWRPSARRAARLCFIVVANRPRTRPRPRRPRPRPPPRTARGTGRASSSS